MGILGGVWVGTPLPNRTIANPKDDPARFENNSNFTYITLRTS